MLYKKLLSVLNTILKLYDSDSGTAMGVGAKVRILEMIGIF